MGIFSRGKRPPAAGTLAELPAEREVIVVGTEHHPSMKRVSSGEVRGVTVEPEPRNKHDRNAVLVRLDGAPIGYLSAALAKRYRPLISGPFSVAAHARMTGGGVELFVMLPKVP